jgi:hypothetical protein
MNSRYARWSVVMCTGLLLAAGPASAQTKDLEPLSKLTKQLEGLRDLEGLKGLADLKGLEGL